MPWLATFFQSVSAMLSRLQRLFLVIFLILVLLASLFFIPSFRFKISAPYSQTHEKADERYASKDAEGHRFAFRVNMHGKGKQATS